MVGTTFAHYEVTARLGAGGMGEVYRARDTKLGRDVAIKVLPEVFASDPDRVARFEREARVLAALNHVRIGAIYGLEHTGSAQCLVLELVEGDTLAERLARGPLPVAEALRLALQIVEALEAAHDKGVVHRDLKPANIKITPDGQVKVLDFGLAKAFAPEPSNPELSQSPTLSLAATAAGMILGTAAYMSPEQAKGSLHIDHRSDLFSFGCVLYEMLTGRRAFHADTAPESLAWVLARDADFSLLPANLNPRLVDLTRRCLQKDLKLRWQAAGDLRVELAAAIADPHGLDVRGKPADVRQRVWRGAALIALGAVVGAVAVGATWWIRRPAPAAARITRFALTLADTDSFSRTGRHVVAVSPDGSSVVYVANNRLYLRRLSDLEAQPIPGTDQDVNSPFFSPDGRWVGFYSFRDNTLKKIALTGGAVVTLCKAANPFGVSWMGDTIVFGQGPGGILAVSANGGKPEPWGRADPAEMAASPYLLPDGRSLLFTVTPMSQAADRWNRADIVVQPRGGERRVLVRGGGDARYLPTGHIVYAVGTNVLVAPFDLQRLELTGDAVPLVEGVARAVNPGTTTAAAQFDVASDGTLVYVPAASVMGANGQRSLALVDRDGRVEPLALPPSSYQKPRLSPDGTQLAVGTFDEDGNNLWIYDLAKKGALRRLTFDGNSNSPIWSADGRHVVFASTRDGRLGLFRQAVDGTGAAVRLSTVAVGEEVVDPTAWSRDGRTVVFDVLKNGDWGVATLSAEAGGAARPLVDVSGSIERGGEISPDGRWMAYLSDTGTTGLEHAFVEPFPPTGAKYQVSRAHAHGLTWSPDGREIVYFDAESRRFTAVPVQTQPSFSAGVPMPLPIASVPLLTESSMDRHYDFTPDGKRLLMLIPASTGTSERSAMQQITVVLNWFEELRQRTSSR